MNGFGGTSLVFRLINLDNSKININIIDIIGGAKITSQKRDFIIVHESDIVYHKPMIKPKYLK